MKKLLIILVLSIILTSCWINHNTWAKNNNLNINKKEVKINNSKNNDVENEKNNMNNDTKEDIKLTPDDEKMINDLLNF